jgi:two-component system response regulator AtoC
VQAKLLRVLQEQEVQPLGSSKVEKVDVRLVASTHRDLAADVKAGRFREDLYYRVAVVELTVPPLRDRPGDIPLLAREFARKYSERFGLGHVVQLQPELVELLAREKWPGNVRQLENTIRALVALATGGLIGPSALNARWSRRRRRARRRSRPTPRAGRRSRSRSSLSSGTCSTTPWPRPRATSRRWRGVSA